MVFGFKWAFLKKKTDVDKIIEDDKIISDDED